MGASSHGDRHNSLLFHPNQWKTKGLHYSIQGYQARRPFISLKINIIKDHRMSYSDSNLKKSSIESSNNNAEPKGSKLSKALFNTNKEQCSLATLFQGHPQEVLPTTVAFQVILYQHTSCPHLTDHLKSLVLQVELESSYSLTKIRQHLRPQSHPTKLVFENPFFFSSFFLLQ